MKADLHTHSCVSDGTDTPTQLVANARAAGLDIVALTDHDTFDGWDEARQAAHKVGIGFVPGIEMSCKHLGASVHLLGYGPAPTAALNAELEITRQARNDRLPMILESLTRHGMPLSEDDVRRVAAGTPSIGRPHVADAMVERGYVADRTEAFAFWLAEGKPAYIDRYAIDLFTGINLVNDAGGVAVIAHPWSRQSKAVLTPHTLELLHRGGLAGVEVDHPDHDEPTRAALKIVASDIGLLATGSSDYHGLGKKNNDLGCDTTSEPVWEALKARISGTPPMLG